MAATNTFQNQPSQLGFQQYLTVPDVAAILAVSDDTVLKQFASLEGVIDIGTPATSPMQKRPFST